MSGNYGITTGGGDVNAKAMAVGPNARATYTDNSRTVAELQTSVDALIAALAQHRATLADPAGLIQVARAVRTEVAATRPNRAKISELLKRIADGVSTATSLTAAVANLQHAVGRLF
jgi:hypothetical protein